MEIGFLAIEALVCIYTMIGNKMQKSPTLRTLSKKLGLKRSLSGGFRRSSLAYDVPLPDAMQGHGVHWQLPYVSGIRAYLPVYAYLVGMSFS